MNLFKSLLLVSAIALPLSISANAADMDPPADVPADVPASDSGLYLRGDAAWSFLEWSGGSDDNNFGIGGGIGYQFNDMFRTDMTLDYAGNYDVGPGADLSTTTLLGNAYLDIANDSMFTPYVGAGVGYGWVNGKGAQPDDDGIAAGLAAGVAVDLTNNLAVDVGYRYRNIMISGPNTQEHQATVGMRFKF
jgi:opacity protein-like surface antigen